MVAYDYPLRLWTLTLNLTILFYEQYKLRRKEVSLARVRNSQIFAASTSQRRKVEAEIDRPCKIAPRHFRSSRPGREHAHASPPAGAPPDPHCLSQSVKFTFTRLLFAQRLS
jgi:hypothetical protein